MYVPTKWGAKEPQNPQNHKVVRDQSDPQFLDLCFKQTAFCGDDVTPPNLFSFQLCIFFGKNQLSIGKASISSLRPWRLQWHLHWYRAYNSQVPLCPWSLWHLGGKKGLQLGPTNQTPVFSGLAPCWKKNERASNSQMLNVWYIYLHLPSKLPKL